MFKRTLPVTTGNTGWGRPLDIWENLAETSNMGVEATINSHNIKTKDFHGIQHYRLLGVKKR